jgi:hypothetical protein
MGVENLLTRREQRGAKVDALPLKGCSFSADLLFSGEFHKWWYGTVRKAAELKGRETGGGLGEKRCHFGAILHAILVRKQNGRMAESGKWEMRA